MGACGAHGDLDSASAAAGTRRGAPSTRRRARRADVCGGVPAVEVTDERDAERGGRPLAEVRAAAAVRVMPKRWAVAERKSWRVGLEARGLLLVPRLPPRQQRESAATDRRCGYIIARCGWQAWRAPQPTTTARVAEPWPRSAPAADAAVADKNRAPQFSRPKRCRPTKSSPAHEQAALSRALLELAYLRLRRRHDGPPPHCELSRPLAGRGCAPPAPRPQPRRPEAGGRTVDYSQLRQEVEHRGRRAPRPAPRGRAHRPLHVDDLGGPAGRDARQRREELVPRAGRRGRRGGEAGPEGAHPLRRRPRRLGAPRVDPPPPAAPPAARGGVADPQGAWPPPAAAAAARTRRRRAVGQRLPAAPRRRHDDDTAGGGGGVHRPPPQARRPHAQEARAQAKGRERRRGGGGKRPPRASKPTAASGSGWRRA